MYHSRARSVRPPALLGAMRQAVSILAVAALAGGPLTSAQLSWVRGTSDTLRINVTVAAQSSGPHPRSPTASPPIVDAAPLVYSLALGPGEPWLESAPVSVFAGSTWYTSGTISTALILAGTASESAGTDPALGQFDALTIPWRYGPSSSPSRFNTTIKYYSELGAVAFEQAFVDGISHVGTLEQPPLAGRGCETGINTTTLPLAEFPAFRSGPGTRLSELGYTTWAGTCCWRLRVGGGVGLGEGGGGLGGVDGGVEGGIEGGIIPTYSLMAPSSFHTAENWSEHPQVGDADDGANASDRSRCTICGPSAVGAAPTLPITQ